MKYPLCDVDIGKEEVQAVAQVVRSKWLSTGPRTAEFEARFAEMFGVKHAIAVSNCTAALHLSLKACGIGPGDEVLVPSYTFVATANAVLYQGATPIFVDISGPHDLNLSIADLERKITHRTAAIMPVHLGGYAADMDAIGELARRNGLAVIEDACHAIGASWASRSNGASPQRKLGTIGNVGCFSFFANKNLATGEGGMVVTDDDDIARRVRLARSHGMSKSSWDKANGRAVDYDVVDLGYNYRSTEIASAIGLVQLGKLARNNARRGELTRRYRTQLADCTGFEMPFADRGNEDSGFHIFPIVLDDPAKRPAFRKFLQDREVQTSVHYPPVHLFTHYRELGLDNDGLATTVDVARREVTLPLHPLMGDSDVDAISEIVRRAAAKL